MDQSSFKKLARSYLRSLARTEYARNRIRSEFDDGPDFAEEAAFSEKIATSKMAERGSTLSTVPADLAAAAVLVARAIHAEPDLPRRLREDAPVVVLATGSAETVALVRKVIQRCAFPARITAYELTTYTSASLGDGKAVFVSRDGTSRDHRADSGNDLVRCALHACVPIVGIAPDPARQLPRDLVRAAEHSLVLPVMDRHTLELVVEAVTGGVPKRPLDDDLLGALEIGDFPIAVRRSSSPDGCIDAIARIVAAKAAYPKDGPTLEDLHGYGAAKDWGLALAADLHAYRAGTVAWADIDNRGLLLSGPPGVGKTSYVRALARTARVPLVATSVAQWNSADHLGGTLRSIRDIFASAWNKAPAILFIDELDGISDRLKIRGEYNQYWTQIINLVLELLSGIEDHPGVVVIAATNHPDHIDPALRRAGRLDREIAIRRPDTSALAGIFRHYLGPDTLPDGSIAALALAARGGTGADVETFVRRARGSARRAGRMLVHDDLLHEIRQGRRALTGETRRRVAVHEAGHAIVCKALSLGTIADLSLHDGGGVMLVDDAIGGETTLPRLEDVLAMILAGRVAEEIQFEAGSIGVGIGRTSDLALATNIARDIELRFGLGIFGPIYVERSNGDLFQVKGLLAAVVNRLRKATNRAKAILIERRSALDSIAAKLIQADFLSDADVDYELRISGFPPVGVSERFPRYDAHRIDGT